MGGGIQLSNDEGLERIVPSSSAVNLRVYRCIAGITRDGGTLQPATGSDACGGGLQLRYARFDLSDAVISHCQANSGGGAHLYPGSILSGAPQASIEPNEPQ